MNRAARTYTRQMQPPGAPARREIHGPTSLPVPVLTMLDIETARFSRPDQLRMDTEARPTADNIGLYSRRIQTVCKQLISTPVTHHPLKADFDPTWAARLQLVGARL